jgi:hypothetical protein
VIDVKLVQPSNVLLPIAVTLFGIVIEVKLVQPSNACGPIQVTLFGMVIDVKPVQPLNAKPSILVTLLGIMLFWVPDINVLSEFRIKLFPSLRKCVLPAATCIVSKFGVLVNGFEPIEVTLLGMVIEVKPVQPLNAHDPIDVTLFGTVIDVKPVQP